MAKEKEQKQSQQANKYVIAAAKNDAEKSVIRLEMKAEESLKKYEDYKARGKYKEAIQELKWYNINEKLKTVTEHIVELLDRVQGFADLFATLEQVNVGLSAINSFQQGGSLKALKKNFKGLGKCLRKMDKMADELLGAMDNLFGDKPNIFVRFVNFISGKKETDAERLAKIEGEIKPPSSAAKTETVVTDTTKKDDGGADKPITGPDDKPNGWT